MKTKKKVYRWSLINQGLSNAAKLGHDWCVNGLVSNSWCTWDGHHLLPCRFLPTAPKSQLLGEQSLVDWLPYDSIDVVFNKTQLWANRQNRHPACITYNFEDSYPINEAQEATGTWMTLLSDEERSNYSIRYVTDNVLMEPSLKHSQLRQLESQLVTESQVGAESSRSKMQVSHSTRSGKN